MSFQNRGDSVATPKPFIPRLSHQASDRTIRPDAPAPNPEVLLQGPRFWDPAHEFQQQLKIEDSSVDSEDLPWQSLDFGAQDEIPPHQPLEVTASSSIVPDPPSDLPNGALTARRAIRRSKGFARGNKSRSQDRVPRPPPAADGPLCRKHSLPAKFEHHSPPENLLEADLMAVQIGQPVDRMAIQPRQPPDFFIPSMASVYGASTGTSDYNMSVAGLDTGPAFSVTSAALTPRLTPSEYSGTDTSVCLSHVGGWLHLPEDALSAGTSLISPLSVSPLSAPSSRASTIVSKVSRRDSETSYRSTRKRSKLRASDDEDDDDEDATDSRKPGRKSGSGNGSGNGGDKYFACPYYKRDPIKHGSCLKFELRRIKDVKQHIYRKHRRPEHHCPVCSAVFPGRPSLEDHVRLYNTRLHEWRPPPEGISSKQHQALQQRGNRKDSLEMQWMDIWGVVFPDHEMPESVYLGSHAEESVATLRDVLARRGGSRVIASALVEAIGKDLSASLGGEKGEEVVELVRSSMDRILEGLLQETKAAMSSTPAPSSTSASGPSSNTLNVPQPVFSECSASSSASSYPSPRPPEVGEPEPGGSGEAGELADPPFSDTFDSDLRRVNTNLVPGEVERFMVDLPALFDNPSLDLSIVDAPAADLRVPGRHTF